MNPQIPDDEFDDEWPEDAPDFGPRVVTVELPPMPEEEQ